MVLDDAGYVPSPLQSARTVQAPATSAFHVSEQVPLATEHKLTCGFSPLDAGGIAVNWMVPSLTVLSLRVAVSPATVPTGIGEGGAVVTVRNPPCTVTVVVALSAL